MDGLFFWRIGLFLCTICFITTFAVENDFFRALEGELRSLDGRVRREVADGPGGRRGGRPPFGRRGMGGLWRMKCCGDEKTINKDAIKERFDSVKPCFKEMRHNSSSSVGDPYVDMYSCDRMKEMKRHHICFAECSMKKLETIDDDGNINLEKVKEITDTFIVEDWMKDVSNAAAEKCAKSKDIEIIDETGESKCNPAALNFKHCMWKEVLLSCPAEHQIKGNFCDRIRARLTDNENKVN